MADLVMGTMGSLIPKLYELLKEEYNLQTHVKDRIRSFSLELEHAQAAMRKVAQVPWDQLDEQVQLWAREVREASYDMEDVLDVFLVRVQGPNSVEQEKGLLKPLKKIANLLKTSKARRKISGDVKDIMAHIQEVAERCQRYKVDDIVARPATASSIDPRLHAMYNKVKNLVGIDKSSRELISMLKPDDISNTKIKIVSIVGVGGLGKTTLAKAVYDNIKGDYDCGAFVPVGRNPDLKKVFKDILFDIDKKTYLEFNKVVLDERQLIDELRSFLQNKRYFIVIDDLWEKQSWETLKLAFADDKIYEGRIIVTTRKWEVAENADEVYKLPPLPYDRSRELFYSRIYGDEYIDYQQPDEVSDEILRKCAGIPLAIITMASLLVDEPRDRWFEVYKSIGFGYKDNEDAENIMKNILSFSYYDLPSHLRACLLYLGAFPEDSVIPKVLLVWMWAAEGFVQKQRGKGLFEIGEGYFNDLTNRSLIQEVEPDYYEDGIHHGCRVHDMVLDFIRSMSHEENFFTVSDNNNDQVTLVRRNVLRRLAHHNNKVMLHSNLANMFDVSKVRSFVAVEWVINTWVPLSSFKLLRVLYIDAVGDDSLKHLGHLLHLRYLGIKKRRIEKIPEELGALKMLQTLDLSESMILEVPSSCSLPTQLVCLRIQFDTDCSKSDAVTMLSVGSLTSLEELSIKFSFDWCGKGPRRLVKELAGLRELSVLDACICLEDTEMETDLIESVRHLHKLQHLRFHIYNRLHLDGAKQFVLPGDVRYFQLSWVQLVWLPPCIDPLSCRKLSHLDLSLVFMNEQKLKTLGSLPELRFLELYLSDSSPTIHNISDSDPCYFPKLRCLRLRSSLVLFVVNNGHEKKTVSFQIWDGIQNDTITMPHSDGEKGDDELQLPSISDDVHHSRRSFQSRRLQDEEKKKGSVSTSEGDGEGSAIPRFMPRLEVLHFHIRWEAVMDPRYYNNLGLEFLSSLRKISVDIGAHWGSVNLERLKTQLRSAAQVHPNHPTLRMRLTNS